MHNVKDHNCIKSVFTATIADAVRSVYVNSNFGGWGEKYVSTDVVYAAMFYAVENNLLYTQSEEATAYFKQCYKLIVLAKYNYCADDENEDLAKFLARVFATQLEDAST